MTLQDAIDVLKANRPPDGQVMFSHVLPLLVVAADVEVPEPDSLSCETRERLAAYAHDAWAGWMRYLFSRSTPAAGGMLIPAAWVGRWQHQMDTPYKRLSALEQESDRHEADRMLAIMTRQDQEGR